MIRLFQNALSAVIVLLALCITNQRSCAAEFQNLDFEEVTLRDLGSGVLPATLAGWGDFPTLPHVGFENDIVVITNDPRYTPDHLFPPIAGDYSLYAHGPYLDYFPTTSHTQHPVYPVATRAEAEQLLAYATGSEYGPEYEASISQVGDVPPGANSFWIAARVPLWPSSGGQQTPYDFRDNVKIAFNGHELQISPVDPADAVQALQMAGMPTSLPQDVTFFAGNISSIAGLPRELRISTTPKLISLDWSEPDGTSGTDWGAAQGNWEIDSLIFSPLTRNGPAVNVPEPVAVALIAAAIPALFWRRRAQRSVAMNASHSESANR